MERFAVGLWGPQGSLLQAHTQQEAERMKMRRILGWDNSRSTMQCRWDALLKDVSVRISPDGKEHGTTAR